MLVKDSKAHVKIENIRAYLNGAFLEQDKSRSNDYNLKTFGSRNTQGSLILTSTTSKIFQRNTS